MSSILKPFLQLCLLDKGPQDLVSSRALMVGAALAYCVLNVVIAYPKFGLERSVLAAVLELLVLLAFTGAVLRATGHPERFTQTVTALSAVSAVASIALLPAVWSIQRAAAENAQLSIEPLLYLIVVIWVLSVTGHIYRHALSLKGIGMGILVALGLWLVSAGLISLVIPVGA